MSNLPDAPDTNKLTALDGVRRSRTRAAGRYLFKAVREDFAAFLRRVSDRPQSSSPGSTGHHAGWASGLLTNFVRAVAVAVVLGTLAIAVAILLALRDLPLDNSIAEARERELLLEAADGKPLGRVGPLKVSNASRSEFPSHVVTAVISAEDRRFYQHWGVDPVGILRAARRNFAAGAVIEGGSTITQQLVKLRMLNNERTLGRKLREGLAAIWLEMRLPKDEILTRYLNSVYMGAGAQGLPAAAKLYFNKELAELTLSEAALLAGLIKAPSRFNPLRNSNVAQERAEVVLNTMEQTGAIDRQSIEDAKAHPASLNPPVLELEADSWFSDWVAREAQDVTGRFAGTTKVRTTLVPELQSLGEQVIADALNANAERNVSQGALVAMRPDGAVVAMVGGRDYKESQFNRSVQAQRQPGSAFKVFVYMAALRQGWTLNDTIEDTPLEIDGWRPDNFNGRYSGTVRLADAFARSLNAATVRLAQKVGIENVIGAARDLGISAPLPKVPSLALGSAEVNLLNLTAAYAGIMAGRAPLQPWGVTSFSSPERPRVMTIGAPVKPRQELGVLRSRLIELLRLPVDAGTAQAAALDGLAAGKTGTTQNHRDAWFVGFNESLVVGIWVGNDDRTPMDNVTGGSLAAGVWKNFMTRAAALPQVAAAPSIHEINPIEEPAVAATPSEPGKPPHSQGQCDYRACAATYQSFDPADCSYRPYGRASRARCEKSPLASRAGDGAPKSELAAASEASSGRCNLATCGASYSSFRSSDCTYQPYDGGPRRLCVKPR